MTNTIESDSTPDALLLISSHCPHCEAMLKRVTQLVKDNEIGRLEVTNLESHAELAQHYHVRSVPWLRIGHHELTGAQTLDTIRQRITWAKQENDNPSELISLYDHQLSEAQADKVVEQIKQKPETISAIMSLLSDSGTVLSTRIGIGVIMEEFENTPLIQSLVPEFAKLTTHKDKRIRADVCHYLGLTGSHQAITLLQAITNEDDPEVLETIADSIEDLQRIHGL